jgi:hypothetical protein
LFATRKYCFIILFLLSSKVCAVDNASLDIRKIIGNAWNIEGMALRLINLNQGKPQFSFFATKLTLPKPFSDLSLANIQCTDFTWNKQELHCNKGRASVKSKSWQSPSSDFSFHLSPNKHTFSLSDARILGSRFSLVTEVMGNDWQGEIDAKQISNDLLGKLLPSSLYNTNQNQKKQPGLSLKGTLSGSGKSLKGLDLIADVTGLTDQTQDGKIAAENLSLQIHLLGKRNKSDWFWHVDSQILSGALYIDPVYLETGKQPITLSAQGTLNAEARKVDVKSFTYQHPDVGMLSGSVAGYLDKVIKLDKANVNLQSNSLQGLLTTYINPFLTDSPLTGITAAGELQARFSFAEQALIDTSVNFSKLNVNDETGRLAIKNGAGSINWSDDPLQTKQSELAWQQLTIKGLPLESARLKFSSQANHVKLAEKIKLPFYNGFIAVDNFNWRGKKQDEPDVSFAGSMDKVSLEQLSKALGWTPLLGNISGQIPGVEYHDKILSLDGELRVKVFDGTIKVNNLSSSGLFTEFPNVSADVAVENLDLDQLTRKFEFGNITGRLSGYVNKLVLENWHPITFFAWLGTPDDDDSSHRISQKAVNNIASIGGGGAADLISRSFLGFFDTFGYDKMGVGCYLHNGVCQMIGLEAAKEGYYLIKGGGLPRIDVLGYNSQVNWDVLVERLGRVASPDKVIVQ